MPKRGKSRYRVQFRHKTRRLEQAQKIHKSRSAHAQSIDDNKIAPVSDFGTWAKDPNRYDIPGVDLHPIKLRYGDIAGNFDELHRRFSQSFENVPFGEGDVIFTSDPKEWANVVYTAYEGRARGLRLPYAFIKEDIRSGPYINMGPEACRILRKGKINNYSDFSELHYALHEIAHTTRSVLDGQRRMSKEEYLEKRYPRWMEEGTTEIATLRWLYQNYPLSQDLRYDLRDVAFRGRMGEYRSLQFGNALMALWLSNGNPYEAIDLIETMRDGYHYTSSNLEKIIITKIGRDKALTKKEKKSLKLSMRSAFRHKNETQFPAMFMAFLIQPTAKLVHKQGYDPLKLIGQGRQWWILAGDKSSSHNLNAYINPKSRYGKKLLKEIDKELKAK